MTKKKIRIAVTAKDIEQGARLDGASCMVARAIRRRLVDGTRLHVSSYDVTLHHGRGDDDHFALPARVFPLIRAFDRGDVVKPFTFVMELPAEVLL